MQHVRISDLHIFDYCSYPRLLLCTFIMLCLLINVNKNDFCKTYECLINRLSSETKASMPKHTCQVLRIKTVVWTVKNHKASLKPIIFDASRQINKNNTFKIFIDAPSCTHGWHAVKAIISTVTGNW